MHWCCTEWYRVILLSVLGCVLLVVGHALGSDVTILQSDEQGVTFLYRPPEPLVERVYEGENEYSLLCVPGCSFTDIPGQPQLPVRRVHVGIPLNGRVQARVISSDDRSLGPLRIAPVPILRSRGPDMVDVWDEYREDPQVYSSSHSIPSQDVEVEVGYLRNQKVAVISAAPASYIPATGQVVWRSEMRVRVDFTMGEGTMGERTSSDQYEGIYRSLLANYHAARYWRRQIAAERPLGNPGSDGPWVKMLMVNEGVYRVTYQDLVDAGVDPLSISPRTLKVFNGGSAMLPWDLDGPRPELAEIPIAVIGEMDGRFDEEDTLYFYGVPLSRWILEPSADTLTYQHHLYADTNAYWLTWTGSYGMRMPTIQGRLSDPSPLRPQSFPDVYHLEEDHWCPALSGLGWVWDTELNRPSTDELLERDYSFDLPGGLGDEPCTLTVCMYGKSNTPHFVRVLLNDGVLGDAQWSGMLDRQLYFSFVGTGLRDGQNTITLQLRREGSSQEDNIYLDFFQLKYRRDLHIDEQSLTIRADPTWLEGRSQFDVTGIHRDQICILDITDPFAPSRIVGWEHEGDTVRYQASPSRHSTWVVGQPRPPIRMEIDSPYDLRIYGLGADYLILCYDGFVGTVAPLAEWRRSHLGGVGRGDVRVVRISDVYDNFSGGVKDPTAIRNFLRWTFENWSPQPAFCLLVGDGSYDYKNNFANPYPKKFIPPHEEGFQVVVNWDYVSGNPCFDDWYVHLTPGDSYPDMAIGRLAVHSAEEVEAVVTKILLYERGHQSPQWKSRTLFVADDERSSYYKDEDMHTRIAENVAEQWTPLAYDRVKVYLMEYEQDASGKKPGAREAMIDAIDRGALLGMYVGHGNPGRLAHEWVARNPTDIDALDNDERTPFFYYASCGVGQFDRADVGYVEESFAGYMQRIAGKGAIATLAATRATRSNYGSPNHVLAQNLFHLFLTDSLSTVGEVVLTTKERTGSPSEVRYYVLFGDPGSIIQRPSEGLMLSAPDTLVGGVLATVDGSLGDGPAHGNAYMYTFDSAVPDSHIMPNGRVVKYLLPGAAFFWGGQPFSNRSFHISTFVPRGLVRGDSARVGCVVWDETNLYHGALDARVVGVDDTTNADNVGPGISLRANGRPLFDGDYVPQQFELTGVLSDQQGIYLSPVNAGAQLSLVINDDVRHPIYLSERFEYDEGSYQQGQFTLPLDLSDTSTVLKVRASDNLLNTSEYQLRVRALSLLDLRVFHPINYPNPFSDYTSFVFDITHDATVTIRIYTLAGRCIRVLDNIPVQAGSNQIPWDGRDADGDRLANGVYLYVIQARTHVMAVGSSSPSEMEHEVRGKLLVMR
jgi:hypothetical protein